MENDAAHRLLIQIRLFGGAEIISNMKKYLVFTYYVGRSHGGIKDFLDGFDSVEEALDNILLERNRYYQIVEKDSMKVVREGLAMFKNFVPEKFSSGNSLLEE